MIKKEKTNDLLYVENVTYLCFKGYFEVKIIRIFFK